MYELNYDADKLLPGYGGTTRIHADGHGVHGRSGHIGYQDLMKQPSALELIIMDNPG